MMSSARTDRKSESVERIKSKLKELDDHVGQLRRIYLEGYSDQAICIAKQYFRLA